MDVKQLTNELAISVYAKRDVDKSKQIYELIIENNLLPEIEQDIYNLVPVISYHILVNDINKFKYYLEFLREKIKKNSKYEQYFLYYFNAIYFYNNDHNFEASIYAINLIDIVKLKKYIKCDYIEYFIGMVFLLKGNAYLMLKDFDKAIKSYSESMKYFNDEEALSRKLSIKFNSALIYIHQGKFDDALRIFYDTIEEYEGVPEYKLMYHISVLEFLRGNINKSKQYFDSLEIDLDKKNDVESIYTYNAYKYFGALLHYYLKEERRSKEFLNDVNLDISYNKDTGYFYKVITSLVNKDFSNETVYEIKNIIIPFYKKSFNGGNIRVCQLYFEELEKYKM